MFNPFEPTLSLQGLIRSTVRMTIAQSLVSTALERSSGDRASQALNRFIVNTPVLSGAARAGWRKRQEGPMTWVVFNEVENKGVAYPGLLITGTGKEGLPTPGFNGSFSSSIEGMEPASGLRAVWIDESTRPMSFPKLF